jgi:hypothetical protein
LDSVQGCRIGEVENALWTQAVITTILRRFENMSGPKRIATRSLVQVTAALHCISKLATRRPHDGQALELREHVLRTLTHFLGDRVYLIELLTFN